MIYFTSDLHLGDENIIEYCKRPFSSVEEMDEELIYNWNKRVKPEDTVYIVGGLIGNKQKTMEYLEALAGIKFLIPSDEDMEWLKQPGAREHFALVVRYYKAELLGYPMTLCHYPMLEFDSRNIEDKKPGYMIHGHVPNQYRELYHALYRRGNILNAAVDTNDYVPVTFEELKENNRIHKRKMLYLKGR